MVEWSLWRLPKAGFHATQTGNPLEACKQGQDMLRDGEAGSNSGGREDKDGTIHGDHHPALLW